MNFFNLLIHSLSIIAVFKSSVVVRSILFLLVYLFFISNNLTFITLFPILIIFTFLFFVLKISTRENIKELNNCLENIDTIDVLNGLNNRQ